MEPNDETALFARALGQPEEERAAFLSQVCAGDMDLRRRIEALLAAHESPDTALAGKSGTRPPAEQVRFSCTESEEAVGQRLGRFKLLEKLGEGGCGIVYVAEQTEPVRRRVALKVIKLGMDTKQVIARFEAERQALAMMEHPNIAKVLDAGTTERGRPYFVMELVRGIPITDYCDQTNLPMAERLDLFVKVCRAIQHAHQKGIIHRDIKPSNILVTLHDGVPVPKVIDFGIAKATEGRLTDATVYTQLHQFVGTPAYMSPEQAEMSGLDIDTRSDIYSLGVLLYELLAGRTPFDGRELVSMGLEAMRRTIREAEPARPSTRLATLQGEELTTTARRRSAETSSLLNLLKGDLDWIVMKCLEKDRQRRYETANGLAADISRHLSNEPVVARPPSNLYRFRKAWRRNRLFFNAGLVVVVTLVAGILMAAFQARRARVAMDLAQLASRQVEEQRRLAEAEAGRANSAEQNEARLRREAELQGMAARRRSYAADMLLCEQALRAKNLREARQLLDRQRPRDGETDLRGWEWRHLWERCRSGARAELATLEERVVAVKSVAGGDWFTFEQGGKLQRWHAGVASGGTVLQGASKTGLVDNSGLLCASADGRRIAAVGYRADRKAWTAGIWDVTQEVLVSRIELGDAPVKALALSPDHRTLAALSPADDSVTVWDLGTAEMTLRIPLVAGRRNEFYGALCYSPDGNLLAIGDGQGGVQVQDIASGEVRAKFRISGQVMALDFSPDSRRLAAGGAFVDPRITIWNLDSGKAEAVLNGHAGFITDLEFSHDGGLLASASADQTIRLWDTATWAEDETLLGHTDEVWSVAFAGHDNELVSGGKDRRVLLWSVGGAPSGRDSILLKKGRYSSVDAAPDGRRFVLIEKDGVVHLWGAGETDSAHPELGADHVAAFWVAPDEVVLGAREPARMKVWNPRTGSLAIFPLATREDVPKFAYLRRSREVVATLPDPTAKSLQVIRWSVATRRKLSDTVFTNIPGTPLHSDTLFAQDGRSMVNPVGGRSVAMQSLTDRTTGKPLLVRDRGKLQGLAIFPDGNQIASAGTDRPVIDIWDTVSRRKVRSLHGHNLVIIRLEVSADGHRLLSSTIGSEPVKLWDTESGQQVARLVPRPGTFLFRPHHLSDGNSIGAAEYNFDTDDFGIRIWQAPSWEEIETVEASGRWPIASRSAVDQGSSPTR